MLLAAIGVSWAAAVLGWGGVLPWIISAVLVALGALTASSYFVSEDSPSITFRTRTTEVSLSLRGDAALRDAYRVANGPFQVQAGQTATAEQISTGEEVTAAVADEEVDRSVEPSSGDVSTADDAPPVVSASAGDEGSAAPEEEPPTEDTSPEEEAPPKVREATAREAAAHLGISRATITRWAQKKPASGSPLSRKARAGDDSRLGGRPSSCPLYPSGAGRRRGGRSAPDTARGAAEQ